MASSGVNPAQAGENRTVQAFRADCLRELKKITMAWPGLNYTTAKGVLILSPSKPAIVPMRVQLVEQPHKGPFQGRNCSLTTCNVFNGLLGDIHPQAACDLGVFQAETPTLRTPGFR